MRLFAALPVTGDALSELTALLGEFAESDWPVRWVKPSGLHLTVKFLGEAAPAQVQPIAAALRVACAGTPILSFSAHELGAFPGLARARVLWAGYRAEPALELLTHRVEQRCAALDFPLEGRPFRPHVTVGRVREGRSLSTEAQRLLEGRSFHQGFVADRLILYDSVTGREGMMYTPLETIPLGP
jgi:2'-5' RNA ligase